MKRAGLSGNEAQRAGLSIVIVAITIDNPARYASMPDNPARWPIREI